MNTDEITRSKHTLLRTRVLGAARTAAVLAGIGLATLAAGPAHAGHVTDPIDHWDTVAAYGTDTYHMTFDDTEAALLEAQGAGDGDIDMFVYDHNGDRVDFDDLADNDPICVWTPHRTQLFTVKIVNCSGSAVTYHLTSN